MDRQRDLPVPNAAADGCEVRAARPADVPRIWEMLRGLAVYERLEHEVSGSAERLAEHLFGPRPPVECLVAESGRGLVGYALFYPTYSSFRSAPTLWLEDLFVEADERGKGTGRRLLAAVARVALERGCRGLAWIVLDWNRPSITFYQRAGARSAEGGWLQYGLDRVGMQSLVESATPTRPAE
jgi:GNAT superfamily N-acetyltransferase